MWIDPDNGDRGAARERRRVLYVRTTGAGHWLHVNTLPIAEFYAISLDSATPYQIWGGTQDNGALYGSARPMAAGLEHWKSLGGGDQYVTRVDPDNPDTMYAEGYHGAMRRQDLKTGHGAGIRPAPPRESQRCDSTG